MYARGRVDEGIYTGECKRSLVAFAGGYPRLAENEIFEDTSRHVRADRKKLIVSQEKSLVEKD